MDVKFEGGSMDGKRVRIELGEGEGGATATDLAATVKERGRDLADGAQVDNDKLAGVGELIGGLVGETWVTTVSADKPGVTDANEEAKPPFSMRMVGRGKIHKGGRAGFVIGTEIEADGKKLEPVVKIIEEEKSVGPLKMKIPKPSIQGDFRIEEVDAEGYAIGRAKGPFTIDGKDDDVTTLSVKFRVKVAE